VLLALFALCLFRLWRCRGERELLKRALPWALLACFALVNAGLTTIGRLGFGVEQALSTRYILFSLWLPLGLLFLVPLLLLHGPEPRVFGLSKSSRTGVIATLGLILACLQLIGSVNSLEAWFETQCSRLRGKAAITFSNVALDYSTIRRGVYEDVPLLKKRAEVLDSFNFLRPKLATSAAIREIADPTSVGNEQYGELLQTKSGKAGETIVYGWAVLPGEVRPADALLLTHEQADGEPVIFALARMGVAQSAMGKESSDAAYDHAGWAISLKPGLWPEDATTVKAWAYNAESGRAYRIKGALQLPL